MSDLSAIIPAIENEANPSADFPGLNLPALANAAHERIPLDQCGSCVKATNGTHKCWRAVGLNMTGTLRGLQQECVNNSNGLRERYRRLQRLVERCHTQTQGISSIPTDSDTTMVNGDTQCSNGFVYTLTGIGPRPDGLTGSLITMQWDGDPERHPWSCGYSYTALDEEGNPASVSARCVLPEGVLQLLWPSSLWLHAGFLVRLAPGQNLAQLLAGGTFNLISDTPIGTLALQLMPGTSGPIQGRIAAYTYYREPWNPIRDAYPLFAKPAAEPLIISGAQPVKYLVGNYLRIPAGCWSLEAQTSAGGPWMPANLGDVVTVSQAAGLGGSLAYSSWLDLIGVNLDGVTNFATGLCNLRLTYMAEAGDSDATIVGENRCRWSTPDYTRAAGVAASEEDVLNPGTYKTVNYFCAQRAALAAIAANAEGSFSLGQVKAASNALNDYGPACYQTACPFFDATATASWPVSEAALKQLIDSVPWEEDQAAVGATASVLARAGTPSLSSLAGRNWKTTTGGQHAAHNFTWGTGGWAAQAQVSSNVLALMNGFEFLTDRAENVAAAILGNAAPTTIALGNAGGQLPSSWPAPGPAANNWAGRMSEYGKSLAGNTVKPGNDPQNLEISTLMSGGSYAHRYQGGQITAAHGLRQRFSATLYQVFFPQIPAGAAAYIVKGNSYQAGMWDSLGQPASDPNLAVYRAKITLAGLETSVTGGSVGAAAIFGVDSALGGQVTLALGHQTLAAAYASAVPGAADISIRWQQGNTNIVGPDFAVVRNYACSQAVTGIMRAGQVRRGLCADFSDAHWQGTPAYGRRFWISWASACGSAQRQSWLPGSLSAYNVMFDDAWYYGNLGGTVLSADLPANHQAYFNRCDQITLLDENGALAATYAAGKMTAGAPIGICYGVALPGLAVSSSSPAAAEDSPAPAQTWAATGEILLPQAAPAGSCLIVAGNFADRSCQPLAAEILAPRICLEKIMGNPY